MKCPYCGEPLDRYERLWNYEGERILVGEEHFACYDCNISFSRDVTYELIKEGELKE